MTRLPANSTYLNAIDKIPVKSNPTVQTGVGSAPPSLPPDLASDMNKSLTSGQNKLQSLAAIEQQRIQQERQGKVKVYLGGFAGETWVTPEEAAKMGQGGSQQQTTPTSNPSILSQTFAEGPITGPGAIPVGGGGYQLSNLPTAGGSATPGTSTAPGPVGSTPTSPPNPYNLPSDLVQGMTQSQQFTGVLQDMQNQAQATNAANEQRYQEILAGYGGIEGDYAQRTADLTKMMEGFGDVQREEIARKFQQQEAGLTQDMINRGMYNTGALDSARRGMSSDQATQQRQLEDQLTRQKLDYLKGLTGEELQNQGNKLQFMERRTDEGPTMEDVASLAAAVGQSQAEIPDYLSAIGTQLPTSPGGTANTVPQAPNVGTTPTLPVFNPNMGSEPNVNLGVQFPGGVDPSVEMFKSKPSGGSTIPSGSGGGGSGASSSGEFDTFSGNKQTTAEPSGGTSSSGGTTPVEKNQQAKKVEQDTVNEMSADTNPNSFWNMNIAPRLAKDPNFDWVNDGVIYNMAPTPLQQRIKEIQRTRALAQSSQSSSGGGGSDVGSWGSYYYGV